jgi:hypothetical protein
MHHVLTQVLVRKILEHPDGYDWRMQDTGLLGVRLDDHREHRLHVWGPMYSVGEPVVHDHPYDFTSIVVAGEMTNTRYVEDPSGTEYQRVRYTPPDEGARTTDSVRLSSTASVLRAGEEYSQLAHELHDSRQVPGTVTIIRMSFCDTPALTVCTAADAPWVSAQARPPTPDELRTITEAALEHFD